MSGHRCSKRIVCKCAHVYALFMRRNWHFRISKSLLPRKISHQSGELICQIAYTRFALSKRYQKTLDFLLFLRYSGKNTDIFSTKPPCSNPNDNLWQKIKSIKQTLIIIVTNFYQTKTDFYRWHVIIPCFLALNRSRKVSNYSRMQKSHAGCRRYLQFMYAVAQVAFLSHSLVVLLGWGEQNSQ